MRFSTLAAGLAAVAGLTTAPACGQNPAPLAVGVMAPDFELTGATRHGVVRDPVSLQDYRGKTVVLAFFFRARSSG